jgi:hypothetical protein
MQAALLDFQFAAFPQAPFVVIVQWAPHLISGMQFQWNARNKPAFTRGEDEAPLFTAVNNSEAVRFTIAVIDAQGRGRNGRKAKGEKQNKPVQHKALSLLLPAPSRNCIAKVPEKITFPSPIKAAWAGAWETLA